MMATAADGSHRHIQITGPGDVKIEATQANPIKVGDRVPLDFDFEVMDLGASDPRPVPVKEIISGKRAVLFAVPGAFTSVCSSKHVPQYVQHYDDLRNKGVQSLVCVAVNDPYVMREWAKALNVDDSKLPMMSDGDGIWCARLGLLQHIKGHGLRAIRHSMLLDDGVVKILNVEEPGPKSYKVSGPEHMLRDIDELEKKEKK
eukprot:jgi/Chrzof1/14124/Cz08g25280.t1